MLLHRPEGWVALPYVWDADQREARLTLGGKRIALTGADGQPLSYAVPNNTIPKANTPKPSRCISAR